MSPTSSYDYLFQAAKLDGCETILDNFRPTYLKYVFDRARTLEENVNETPEACAQRLVKNFKEAAAALEKANRLHETMDQKHYKELVTSDTAYITSGVDKEKGRKVMFFRVGRFYKGSSTFKSVMVILP